MRHSYSPFIGVCLFVGMVFWQWASPGASCFALEAHEIMVLANRNASASIGLAKHYMEKRGIPEGHLVQLFVTDREWCTRDEYERKIAGPLRKVIKERDLQGKIRCLVTVYGIPLRVAAPEMTVEEKSRLGILQRRRAAFKGEANVSGTRGKEEPVDTKAELAGIEKEMSSLRKADQGASVDSELALALLEDYPRSGWVPNPFFLGHQRAPVTGLPDKGDVLMVSRLDGPSPAVVRRLIDESLETEENGLKGVAYFDARWPRPKGEKGEKGGIGYGFYDRSIHLAAEVVRKSGKMKVVVNDKEGLFQPGDCPDAALYCGWYSLARYVDAFEWRPGSVGYHIASAECQTLKAQESQVWCKKMLEKGVGSTLGPVSEPYVQAFPVPELFFGFLLEGYWTLAECYALSQPFWSWQMVLIGDPLYRPFKH